MNQRRGGVLLEITFYFVPVFLFSGNGGCEGKWEGGIGIGVDIF